MQPTNLLLQQISNIARQAGDIIRSAHIPDAAPHQEKDDSFSSDHNNILHQKSGHANFVTYYDSKVQAFLIKALSEILPGASFFGEEDGMDVFSAQYISGYTFVIDPIDGTSNFMKSVFPYVTSIGLLCDGEPFIGVIYAPQSDQLFTAAKGCGAYENGIRIHSSGEPLSMSLVTMGTAPYNLPLSSEAFRLAAAYKPLCIDIRRSGSAAWDICMAASGRTGFYFEPEVQLYDYAAGACIAAEAGAVVTDLEGNPLPFRKGAVSIAVASEGVASSPYLPGDLLKMKLREQ